MEGNVLDSSTVKHQTKGTDDVAQTATTTESQRSGIPHESFSNSISTVSHVDTPPQMVMVQEVEIIQCQPAQNQQGTSLTKTTESVLAPLHRNTHESNIAVKQVSPSSNRGPHGLPIMQVPANSSNGNTDDQGMPIMQTVPSYRSNGSTHDGSMAVMQGVPSSSAGILLPISTVPSVSVVPAPTQVLPATYVHPVIPPVMQHTQVCTAPNSTVGYQLIQETPIQQATLQSFSNLIQLDTTGTFTDALTSERAGGEQVACMCEWIGCVGYFPDRESLIQHVNTEHIRLDKDAVDYKCHWMGCPRRGRGFNARYKMLIHIRTHTNEKPHICNVCQKSFSRLENLKIHKRSHTGEKPYICPVEGCHKAYSNSSDRFKHVRTHQEERPYVCKMPGCNKRYTDPSSLRKHVRIQGHTIHYTPITNLISHQATTVSNQISHQTGTISNQISHQTDTISNQISQQNTNTVTTHENFVNSNQLAGNNNAVDTSSISCTSGRKATRLEELPLDLSRTVAGASVGSGDNYVLKITYVS